MMKATPLWISCVLRFFRVLPLAAVVLSAPEATAQSGAVPEEAGPSCSSSCPGKDGGLCHFALGMFFLRGITNGLPDCIRQQALIARPDGSLSAILRGIGELEAVSPDSSGLQVSFMDLQILRAGGFIALARRQVLEGNYSQGGEAMSAATKLYQGVLRQQSLAAKEIVKVVAGLIRTGAPVDAVSALARLPALDPQRPYMMAEALFSMGDRTGAAEQYSKWIALKCASEPVMLSFDEYGEQQWVYLQRKDSRRSDACQTLPQELRARLEALKLETPYLAGLPKTNDAPVPFRATSDH